MPNGLGILPVANKKFGEYDGRRTVIDTCQCGLDTCFSAHVVFAPASMKDPSNIELLKGLKLETCEPQTLAATAEKAGVTLDELMHHIILHGGVAEVLADVELKARSFYKSINDLAQLASNQQPYSGIPKNLKSLVTKPPELLKNIINPDDLYFAAKQFLAAAVLIKNALAEMREHDPMITIERAHEDALKKRRLVEFMTNLVDNLN